MNEREKTMRFLQYLRQGARALGLSLDEKAQQLMAVHFELLQKWSQRMNLTAVRGEQAAAEKLYLESALLAPLLQADGLVLDAGSGAGFPGLVIKALRPELEIVLVEAREKKAAFLAQAARQMDLYRGLRVENARLGWSGFSIQAREAVSRAAFPPEVWCGFGPALVEAGGRLWFFLNGRQDTISAGISPPPGFLPDNQIHYRLPFCGLERTLLALRRTG